MKKKISIGIAVLVLIAIGAMVFISAQLAPVSKTSEPVTFVVEEGDNLTSITSVLEESEIIKSASMTKLYGKLNGVNNFVVGKYQIDKSWDSKTILKYLTDQSNAVSTEASVTLVPGTWAKDMAKKLSENLNVTEEELLNLWNDEAYIKSLMTDYSFLTNDILNDKLNVSLEGYLAPDTYNFYINASADDITRKLLNQTNVIYNKYKEDFDKSDYSIHEIFTLASITQYESGSYEDDRVIAGIWFNRLDQNMKLESSVTVCYSLYEFDNWEECEKNTRVDSPFNTYVYPGIPIGPILNPGEMSIKATLNPEKTDYLFFIADVYGDNTIYYAKTYEEHTANVNKYLR